MGRVKLTTAARAAESCRPCAPRARLTAHPRSTIVGGRWSAGEWRRRTSSWQNSSAGAAHTASELQRRQWRGRELRVRRKEPLARAPLILRPPAVPRTECKTDNPRSAQLPGSWTQRLGQMSSAAASPFPAKQRTLQVAAAGKAAADSPEPAELQSPFAHRTKCAERSPGHLGTHVAGPAAITSSTPCCPNGSRCLRTASRR